MKNMKEFLVEFRQTIDSAAADLAQLSENESAESAAPDKWSAKQVIGHLIDSAANNHARFVRAQLEEDLVFPGYEQEEWITLQKYQDESWTQLVGLWRLYNLHLAHLMEQVSNEALTKSRARHNLDQIAWKTVPREQPVTLEYFMRDYVGHLKNHLLQIPGISLKE
jgi:hypothetical protein